MVRRIIIGTILSILVFFSISFVTVLFQINSPLNRIHDYYELKIRFPLVYYHKFMVDYPTPNSGWNIKNPIIDCGLTWLLTAGSYQFKKGISKVSIRQLFNHNSE